MAITSNSLLDNLDHPQQLVYSIHSYSSYSAGYRPENILDDLADDEKSRWTGVNSFTGWNTNSTNENGGSPILNDRSPSLTTPDKSNNQFITLELEHMAIVRRIKLGKFHKPHPCNLKEFKVYGGTEPSPNKMNLLFHGGLANNTTPEIFDLRIVNDDGVIVPCKYLRIEPIASHSHNYNSSIWHVALFGNTDPSLVTDIDSKFSHFRETHAIKLILKHLRKRKLLKSFKMLQASTGVSLEHPLITSIHESFVLNGDFSKTEQLLSDAGYNYDLFNAYLSMSAPQPIWKRLDTDFSTFTHDGLHPSPRGGHQLALHPEKQIIYLFGGWDGQKDLADFWLFDIQNMKWNLISEDVTNMPCPGPSPRSCHKIALDEKTGELWLLGKFVETVNSIEDDPEAFKNIFPSDFWKFHTHEGVWEKVSDDVSLEGGPQMIFDHQMVVDSETGMLYVFGGKLSSCLPTQHAPYMYSGLYSYDTRNNIWKLVFEDPPVREGINPKNTLLSRGGHSMLLDTKRRLLNIFAGQRNDAYLSDHWTFNIDTGEINLVTPDYSAEGGPEGAFTQRATIDNDLREWYLRSGVTKSWQPAEHKKDYLWIKKIDSGTWIKVLDRESQGFPKGEEPKPRYAHQMVYDPINKTHWLFGGNPSGIGTSRLGDFWMFSLLRPSVEEILRKCQFIVRKQKFIEICGQNSPTSALSYLQNEIHSIIDHSNEKEAYDYMNCMSYLLQPPQSSQSTDSNNNKKSSSSSPIQSNKDASTSMEDVVTTNQQEEDENTNCKDSWSFQTSTIYNQRTHMFEELQKFFPSSMKEPADDLIDAVPWEGIQ